jgi:hypothetical protein
MLNLVQKAKALLPLCFLGELDKFVGQSNLLVGYLEQNSSPWGEQKGVCGLAIYIFKKLSILRRKKSIIGNSNISSCQNNNLQNNPRKETKIL